MFFSGITQRVVTLVHRPLWATTLCLTLAIPMTTLAQEDGSSTADGYGLVVDGRALEAFDISATADDGTTLSQDELLALLGDETLVPTSDSVVAFAHLEDFAGAGLAV